MDLLFQQDTCTMGAHQLFWGAVHTIVADRREQVQTLC